jgi:periplasmic divalent cation tolerance protein
MIAFNALNCAMEAAMSDIATVTITFGSAEEAERLAAALVEARLAACAQVWPIGSTYRWQGRIEHADEHRLEAKTLFSSLPELVAFVRERHSYEVPEIIAHATSFVGESYARWVRENVG